MGTCNCKEGNFYYGDNKTPIYELSVPNLPEKDLLEELKLSLKMNNEITLASEMKVHSIFTFSQSVMLNLNQF